MQGTGEGRVGVVGEISGFVVTDDQSFQARLGRSLAEKQDKTREHITRFTVQARQKVVEVRKNLAVLRVKLPAATSLAVPGDVVRQRPGGVAPRRLKRLAGVLALHWLARVTQMHVVDGLSRIGRYRASVMVLCVLSCVAVSAALFLPDTDRGVLQPSAGPLLAEKTQITALEQARGPLQAKDITSVPDLRSGRAGEIKVDDIRIGNGSETWQPVKRPFLLYNLEAPEVDAADLVHSVAMRGKNARQDTLVWAARGQKKGTTSRPLVHLVIERFEYSAPTFRPLYSDLAMRAAEQGVSIERMNAPGEFPTKFGGVEVSDAVLATADQGQLGCLVFRRIDTIGLVISGWYCGTAQRPADRVSLSCFIDRMDLVGAGQDSTLKKHFASAERNRRSCAGARQSGRKLTWLDHEAPMPPLKLSASAR